MGDMDSMSREHKKSQLRRRVISPGQEFRWNAAWGEDEEASPHPDGTVQRKKAIRLLGLVLALLGLAALLFWGRYRKRHRYTSYETSWDIPMTEGSLIGYEAFGNNLLKYTKDGASYINNKGKTIWTESYEMKMPIISVNGDFAAIADQQGNSICICSVDGKLGDASTNMPISRVAISGTGIVAVVLEDTTSSYISFFRRDGSPLDILIKTRMAGDGFPMDLSLSQDGTQLMCSYVYLQDGEMKNRVVFYDFSEIGKNTPNRLVGGFDDPFKDTMVPRVAYLAEPYSCAFSGHGPVFFSSKNLASPELIAQVPMEGQEIKSICYSKDYVGLIAAAGTGSEYQNCLEVYRADGSHVLKEEFTYEYTDVYIEDDLVILHNEDSCKIYNMAGVEKLYAEFDTPVSRIRKGRFPNTLIVAGPQRMREIRLK